MGSIPITRSNPFLATPGAGLMPSSGDLLPDTLTWLLAVMLPLDRLVRGAHHAGAQRASRG